MVAQLKIAPLLRGTWWVSVAWLSTALIAMVALFFGWLSDGANPKRYESAIAAAFVLMYSSPAAIGAVLVAAIPGTGLSAKRRIAAIAILCIAVGFLLIFDQLQARYR